MFFKQLVRMSVQFYIFIIQLYLTSGQLAISKKKGGRKGKMNTGKLIRLRQILKEDDHAFIIAADVTLPRGLNPHTTDALALLKRIVDCEYDALLLHSGLVKQAESVLAGKKPFIIKLTTTTVASPDKTYRILVDSVEHALSLGAVGVAMNVFIGSEHEALLLSQFSRSIEVCDRLGIPMIAMMNPMPEFQFDAEHLAYACRVGAELGADIVKTDYPGTKEGFELVVNSCPVPVIVEESPHPYSLTGTLLTTQEAINAGGAGVMFAERVWAQPQMNEVASQINSIVHPKPGEQRFTLKSL
jgi:DhnA family fructose-bisphosphate aldolase class Ia